MQTINHQELQNMLNDDEELLVINVLPEKSFREHHIPGSENIPVDQDDFVQNVESRAEGRDQQIVVYCANTECDASSRAARKLEDAGFVSVFDFEGGIEAWEQEMHRVATGAE